MGLDMFLTRKTYVKNWDYMPEEKKHKFSITVDGKEVDYINKDKISYIEEDVAYWRKANQVHQWFVDNVQDGRDDCGTYRVSIDQIKSLVEICEKISESLKNSEKEEKEVVVGWYNGKEKTGKISVYKDTSVVEELLPPQQGFFFGSTEIGDMYLEDIEITISQLKPLIDKESDNNKYFSDYYYHSSW